MVRDANRYGLIGLLGGHGEGQAGAEVHDGGIVEDKEFALRSALREAVKHYDVVVTTGGASVGRADHAKAVLEAAQLLPLSSVAWPSGHAICLTGGGRGRG